MGVDGQVRIQKEFRWSLIATTFAINTGLILKDHDGAF